MKEQNKNLLAEASAKSNPGSIQIEMPTLEVLLQTKAQIEAFSAHGGETLRAPPFFVRLQRDFPLSARTSPSKSSASPQRYFHCGH